MLCELMHLCELCVKNEARGESLIDVRLPERAASPACRMLRECKKTLTKSLP